MKKIMNKINFAIIGLMVAVPAFAAAAPAAKANGMCDLIDRLKGVFGVLRTLAFVGAAFYIAGWAWGWIAGGEAKPDEIKKRGIALIVGFSLLFAVGLIISFVLSVPGAKTLGCDLSTGW